MVSIPGREREFRAHASPGRLSRRLLWLDECASTNDAARALAEQGEPEGLIVVADRQTAGRGRKGDPWLSPSGAGLWCSLLLRPALEPAKAPGLTLVLAEALVAALDARLGIACAIKEPNDVLLGGRKLAGILAESAMTGNAPRLDFMILGIGVNLRTQFGPDLRPIATALCEHVPADRVPSPPQLLAWLVGQFDLAYPG